MSDPDPLFLILTLILTEVEAELARNKAEMDETAKKRVAAEEAMMRATNDEERAEAARLMKEVQDAEDRNRERQLKAEHDAALVREAARVEADNARERGAAAAAAAARAEADAAVDEMKRQLEEAEKRGSGGDELAKLKADLAKAEKEREKVSEQQKELELRHRQDALARQAEIEEQARKLKAEAELLMSTATTDEEKAAAKRAMEAANAKAELAKVQAMRLEELGFAEQAREEDPGGASNPLATIKALRTIALWEGENMADALRNRMELLGLSKEERAQRDKLMARKNNDEDSDEVPADAASIPISRKMQMRMKLASLQQNTLTLLQDHEQPKPNGGLLWTPGWGAALMPTLRRWG